MKQIRTPFRNFYRSDSGKVVVETIDPNMSDEFHETVFYEVSGMEEVGRLYGQPLMEALGWGK